jgi:hypothetical protein
VRAAAAAVSADLDDDTATAVATRDVTSRFRVKASPTTPAPAAADRTAHFTGFVTRLVRRVVRGMRRHTTTTTTSDDGDGVTERTVETPRVILYKNDKNVYKKKQFGKSKWIVKNKWGCQKYVKV